MMLSSSETNHSAFLNHSLDLLIPQILWPRGSTANSGDYGENEIPGSSHRKSRAGLWLEQKMALAGFWSNVWYWVAALFLKDSGNVRRCSLTGGSWCQGHELENYAFPSSASCVPRSEKPPFLHYSHTETFWSSTWPSKQGFKPSETRSQIRHFVFQEVSDRYFVIMGRQVIKTGRMAIFVHKGKDLILWNNLWH